MIKKYLFLIVLFSIYLKGNSQNNYAVTSIPFQQYTATSVLQGTMDDRYSDIITIPFSFDFYGVSYNQLLVSTNGYIDFRTNLANTNSPFSFTQTIPNVAFPVKNAILGAYADLNNSNGEGTITYGVYGTAPHRKFVVYFYNNSFFSCTASKSSFQMILHETSNIIDVQLIDKQTCSSWNVGRTVSGLINTAGDMGIAAPGRNTSTWTAYHEGWRYYRPNYYTNYSFVRCDDNNDGFQTFNLSVASGDLFSNPSGITFYETQVNAINQTNPIVNNSTYVNQTNPQTIYASGNGVIKQIILSVVDCDTDFDTDTVSSATEDVNIDTNLANDDSDFDGIPNYLDNDDDGDLVLTNVEYVFARTNSTQSVDAVLDTDNDGIVNYLDNDDDGDGVLTFLEDYDRDGNPSNDDTNDNGLPDYLESLVALGVSSVSFNSNQIRVFPNPATTILNIQNNTTETYASVDIYSISGAKVKSLKATESLTTISVADLQSGIYFVKVTMNNQVGNYKFIKN